MSDAGAAAPDTAERFYVGAGQFAESTARQHVARYEFARAFVDGQATLDVACGSGYGSALLADAGASSVVGVDRDARAVEYCAAKYARPNLRFQQDDAQALSFADASFDRVISFETIEHLPDYARFVAEAARVLRPGGRFVVSTPDGRLESTLYGLTGRPRNGHHLVEFTRDGFVAALGPHFEVEELYGHVFVPRRLVPWPVQVAVKGAAYGLRKARVPARFDRVYHEGSGYAVEPAGRHARSVAKYWVAVCRPR